MIAPVSGVFVGPPLTPKKISKPIFPEDNSHNFKIYENDIIERQK